MMVTLSLRADFARELLAIDTQSCRIRWRLELAGAQDAPIAISRGMVVTEAAAGNARGLAFVSLRSGQLLEVVMPPAGADATEFASALAADGNSLFVGAAGPAGSVLEYDVWSRGVVGVYDAPMAPGASPRFLGLAMAVSKRSLVTHATEADGTAVYVFDRRTRKVVQKLPDRLGLNGSYGTQMASWQGRFFIANPDADEGYLDVLR